MGFRDHGTFDKNLKDLRGKSRASRAPSIAQGCIQGPGDVCLLCPVQILTDRAAGYLAAQSDLFVRVAVLPLESQDLFDLAHG